MNMNYHSVEDRLPETMPDGAFPFVLAYSRYHDPMWTIAYYDNGVWYDADFDAEMDDVTHWVELEEPDEEEATP
jgi:hypothetical protein